MRKAGFITSALCALVAAQVMADDMQSSSSPLAPLEQEIRRIAASADVTVGVSLLHLETGRAASVNGDQSFPLASTYKVPMAASGLHQVDQGNLDLDQMIDIQRSDRVVSSVITHSLPHAGVSLSLTNLMDLMLRESDNTATDVFLKSVGGPAVVTAWLRDVGISDLRVDRPTTELLLQFADLPRPEPGLSYMDQWEALGDDLRFEVFYTDADTDAYRAFVADPQDQGTPNAMATLLARLWRGELLSPSSTKLLQEIMARCETGLERIPGLLPPGTHVAHKTGTIAGTVNDAGVITLPEGRGHLVITVFIKNGLGSREEHERLIADIARVAYDYFTTSEVPSQ